MPWVLVLAATATLVHFLFNRQYGYFRDELYYAACGEHPGWGYIDHAPLVAFAARLSRAALGDSLFALRFLPAVSAALKVLLAGWIARETGGGRFAQFLAALAVLLAPVYLTLDSFLSMNSFEPVFWMVCAAIVLRILNGGNPRLWLLFGVVGGVGILNKHSMLFFGSGIAAGLLLTEARREYRRPWIWAGALLAFLVFLPNLLWEMRSGWPTIAILHSVIGTKYSTISPVEFILEQALLTHPLAAPIWLAGLWFCFMDRDGRRYRALGWAYIVVLVEMIVLHGKIYYLAPAYVMLLATGAVWIERRLAPRTGAWLKPAIVAPLLAGALVAAPLAMPVLPVDLAIRYCRFWHVESVRVENVPLGDLPQFFGDMIGWEDQVREVARVFDALPPEERSRATILAYNYGEAGAIDYFGKRYGLPKAVSGHNHYGWWGTRGSTGESVIAIGFPEARLRQSFGDVRAAGFVNPPHAMPEESNLTIYVCRRPVENLTASWGRWMYFN